MERKEECAVQNFLIIKYIIRILYTFDSQRVGTSVINEWNGAAVLSCNGKSSSYIIFLHLKQLGLAVMGTYPLKLLMLFNLDFDQNCT